MDDRWHPARIATFLAIGLGIYLALLAGSEWLVRRTGDRNPFFRITTLDELRQDWIVMGASHALPLDFADMEGEVEAATGHSVLNLAATGAGPFLWRLIAQRYFADHEAGGVLIVVDAFAFRDQRWNEDRVGDSDLLPRVPLDGRTLAVLVDALPRLRVPTLADYGTGFSKINNPDRLKPDLWEAEARFDTSPRPSDAADRARIDYLYPPGDALSPLYLDDLATLIDLAHENGARVVVARPPLPDRFRRLLPDEAAFEEALAARLVGRDVEFRDFSTALPEPRFYLDSDHLNRAGVTAWLGSGLADLLAQPGETVDDGQ